MRHLSGLFLFCMLAVLANAQTPSRKLIWSDEFNYQGLPDSTKWSYDVGGNGWGNKELEYYTKADTNNAVVRNGHLYLTAVFPVVGQHPDGGPEAAAGGQHGAHFDAAVEPVTFEFCDHSCRGVGI